MFGFIIASLPSLSEEEKTRYQACYCGLCRALQDRFGSFSRMTLNYDMTFYVILSNALHEPTEQRGEARCIAHPKKPRPFSRSRFSDLAADFTIALAYHKALDDYQDEHKKRARLALGSLEKAYQGVRERHKEPCDVLEKGLRQIGLIEQADDAPPDAAAHVFGLIFGAIFSHDQGFWSEAMGAFGEQLGRFVYLMDAAVDAPRDRERGLYNPFVTEDLDRDPELLRTILSEVAGQLTTVFSKLPIEQDLHLMESVLYEGIWQQFNKTYNKNND